MARPAARHGAGAAKQAHSRAAGLIAAAAAAIGGQHLSRPTTESSRSARASPVMIEMPKLPPLTRQHRPGRAPRRRRRRPRWRRHWPRVPCPPLHACLPAARLALAAIRLSQLSACWHWRAAEAVGAAAEAGRAVRQARRVCLRRRRRGGGPSRCRRRAAAAASPSSISPPHTRWSHAGTAAHRHPAPAAMPSCRHALSPC